MEPEKKTTTTNPPPPPPDPTSDPPRRRGGKRKSAAGGSSAGPAKRHARERAAAAATTAAAIAAAESAAAAPIALPEKAAACGGDVAVMVTCAGGGDDVAVAVVEEAVVVEDLEMVEGKVEAGFESIRSRDRNAHVVPVPAAWFSWTRIHQVERQTLPSFFNGKSKIRTPEVYMEVRDWIMRKFHADPNTQIEVKDLSELSVGEMDARQEVMEFLDHWGLINYHPFPETDNSDIKVDNKTNKVEDKMETSNSLVDILYRFEREESRVPVVARDNVTTQAVPSRLLPESTVTEELVRQEEPEYHCNSCSADCSRKRYHCQIQADYDLCTECFSSGKFEDMSPADFILMEPAEAAGGSGGKWTDQETLLLLEALELFSENWNEIADHVATKTKTQCILHFAQMPIEESVIDRDDENEATNEEDVGLSKVENDTSVHKDTSETTNSEIKADVNQPESSPMEITVSEEASEKKVSEEPNQNIALKALNEAFEVVGSHRTQGGQFSFAEAGNPAMALAAFLVRLAEPNVATATTRSSLKCINDKSSSVHLAARHCFLLEDPPGDKKTLAIADSVVAESVEVDARKDQEQNKEKENQKQEISGSVSEKVDVSNDNNTEKDKDDVEMDAGKEEEQNKEKENQKHEISGSVSENVDVPNNKSSEKDKDDVNSEIKTPSSSKKKKTGKSRTTKKLGSSESDKVDTPKDQGTEGTKKLDELAPKTETHPSSVMVPVDNKADKTDMPEDSVAKESNNLNEKIEIPSSSVKESGDKAEEPSQPTDSVKEENAPPGALASEMKEGDEESKDNKNENQGLSTIEDEPNIDKLKRVAVTAISAAAVKAKLLADQEEDQIRQLATLLIEKQLHKLETKLAFFSDMDISVTRVREQMERSKQRLYHERAQIIATRFPQSSIRPMQQQQQQQLLQQQQSSLPINRVAMGFANSAARPPMSMNIMQRPTMLRPMMTSAPSSTFVPPSTTIGFSARPINPEKTSNVTK